MQNWITEFMSQFGYLSIYILITLENVLPLIPSEIILTFGGFMTTYSDLTVPGVVLAATGGSVTGAVILYKIGNMLDVSIIRGFIDRWGKVIGTKVEHMYKAENWFKKHGYRAVFFCRMIPLVRSLISIPAGMSKMSFGAFIMLTTIGTLIWNVLLVCGGAYFGESWQEMLHYKNIYSKIIYAIVGIAFVCFIGIWIKNKHKKEN